LAMRVTGSATMRTADPAWYERYYGHIKAWHTGLISLAGLVLMVALILKSTAAKFLIGGAVAIVVVDLVLFAVAGLKTDFARERRNPELGSAPSKKSVDGALVQRVPGAAVVVEHGSSPQALALCFRLRRRGLTSGLLVASVLLFVISGVTWEHGQTGRYLLFAGGLILLINSAVFLWAAIATDYSTERR
jgi:hypothetical protein